MKVGDVGVVNFGFAPTWCSGAPPDPVTTDPEMPIMLSSGDRTDNLCWFAANYSLANYICEKRGEKKNAGSD